MSLNLKDILFESDINKIHTSLLKEESKEREIDGNIQTLSKSTLEMVSKFIAQKIDSVKPPEDKIDKETLKKPLGIIDFQVLKRLSNATTKGMKISPAQIKGEQIPTLNSIDFKAYEKLQVVPLFITNKELENVGGSKTGEEFAAVFYLPALYSAIRKENVPLHRQMFGVEEPKKGTLIVHTAINKLHYEMVAPEEVEKIQKSFMTGNITPLASIERVQTKRIPTGANEKPGDSKDEKNVEEIFKRYEGILLENSERLLEAPAFWEKIKAKFGEKKGEDTNYTFFSEEEIEDSKKSVTQEAGDNKHVYLAKNLGLNPTFAQIIENPDVRKYSLQNKDNVTKEINGIEFVKSFKGNFNKLLNNENLIDLNLFNKEIISKPFSLKFDNVNKHTSHINLIIDSDKSVKITSNFFSKTISVIDPFEKSVNNETCAFFIKPNEQEFSAPQDFTLALNPSFLNSRFGNEYKKTILDVVSKVNNEIKNETFFGKEIDDNIKKSATQYDSLKKAIAAFCCAVIKELYYNVNVKVGANSASVDFVTARIIQFIRYKLKNVDLSSLMSTTLDDVSEEAGVTENESDRSVIERFKEKSSPSVFKQIFSKDSINKIIKDLESTGNESDDIHKFLERNRNFFLNINKLSLSSAVEIYEIENISSFFKDFIQAVFSIEKSVNSKKISKRHITNFLNVLSDFFEKFGEGEELYKKLIEVCKLANRKKNNLDLFKLSFDLSGDITYGEVKKESSPKTKTGLYKSIVESIDSELASISIITNKKLNHKDKDLPFGEELVKRIKSYLTEDLGASKIRKINLDDYLTKSLEGSAIDSLINYNKVIERMKKDSGDLKVLVEKFDDDDFEKHVEGELARTLAKSLAGLLGKNSSLLDHKVNNKNLINEAVSTNIQVGAFVTMLGGVASGVLGAPVLAAGLAAGAATLGAISMYVKIKEIVAKRKDYAKNPDLFANDVIENAKKVVFQCLKGMIISVHIGALLKHESELKAEGITLVHESALMQNIYTSLKKENEKKELKKNLNELGQTIYSEIIDNAYKFKQDTVIGKYINQSSIEKMLINSIFGDTNNPRNKFSRLIKNLQKEGIELKGNQQFIFEYGLKFLLEVEEDDKKSKGRKETYEINKLRLQLSEIITEEFNTLNFKSDIMSALEKEFKKQSQKRAKFFSRKKTRRKESLKVFYIAMQKVLGLSKKEVNNILDMTSEELKQLVGESFNKDFTETILENKRLSLLLEKDYYIDGSKVGDEVFLKYQTDAKGVTNPLRVVKGKLTANGKIDPDSIQLVPVSDMPSSNPVNNLTKSDAQEFIDQMNTKYSGAKVTGGFKGGGLDIKIGDPEGPPIEGAGDPEGQPIEGAGDPEVAQTVVKSPGYTSIEALNTWSLIMLSIKLGLMTYIRLDKRVLAGAEISKMLKDINWAVLPGVAFSEIICRTLLKHKDELKENGIIITGELKNYSGGIVGPDGVAKPDNAGNDQSDVASSMLVNKIRQASGKDIDREDITDKMIANAISDSLSNVCSGIYKMCNKERYEEIKEQNLKNAMNTARRGALGTGWLVDLFGKRSDDSIANKVNYEKVDINTKARVNADTKKDVNSIIKAMIALTKDVKEINAESLYLGRLSNLLFEDSTGATHTVDIEKFKSLLQSEGVLVYNSDLNPNSREFKKAESYMLGTLAGFLETNFGVAVTGKEKYEKLDMRKVGAEELASNEKAKRGEATSAVIDAATKSAGVPQNLQAPFDINQMMMLMNNSGANMMMPFMMMMMMPMMMQQMQQMQQNGASLGDVVNKVKEAAAEEGIEELSELDREIEESIKTIRTDLPSISKDHVKKLIKNITNGNIGKYLSLKNIKVDFSSENEKNLLTELKFHFNISEEKDIPFSNSALEKMFDFIFVITKYKIGEKYHSGISLLILNFINAFFNKKIDIITLFNNFYKLDEKNKRLFFKNTQDFKTYLINDEYNSVYNWYFFDYNEFSYESNTDDQTKFAEDNIKDRKKELLDKLYGASSGITLESRKVKSNNVINEINFLKRELKRLWNV